MAQPLEPFAMSMPEPSFVAEVVTALVSDMNRLHDHLDRVERRHATQIAKLTTQLQQLAANVQGFTDPDFGNVDLPPQKVQETPPDEEVPARPAPVEPPPREEEEKVPQQSPPPIDTKEPELPEHPQEDDARGRKAPLTEAQRARARKHWHRAYLFIKLKRLHERIPLTKVNVGKSHSMAHRLKELESALDGATYRLEQLEVLPGQLAEGKAKFEAFTERTLKKETKVDEELRGIQHRLKLTDAKTKFLDQKTEAIANDAELLRQDVDMAAETATNAADVVAKLSAALGTTDDSKTRARQRRRAALVAHFLCDGLEHRDDVTKILSPVCEVPLFAIDDDDENENLNILRAARYIHYLLEEEEDKKHDWDEETAFLDDDVDEAEDVLAPPREVHEYEGRGFVALDQAERKFVTELGEHRSWNGALRLARDVLAEATKSGLRGLETWYLGGPAKLKTALKFDATTAGLVAVQASLASKADGVVATTLRRRVDAVEKAAKLSEAERTKKAEEDLQNILEAATNARKARETAFRQALDDAQTAIARVDKGLQSNSDDTKLSLDGLRNDLLQLANVNAVHRTTIHDTLASKLDKRDLKDIASKIAKRGEEYPAIGAKLQVLKCLSCNRPLPNQVAIANAHTTYTNQHPEENHPRSPQRRLHTAPGGGASHFFAPKRDDISTPPAHWGFLVDDNVDTAMKSPPLALENGQTYSRYARVMPSASAPQLKTQPPASR